MRFTDSNFRRHSAPDWLVNAALARIVEQAPKSNNLYTPTKAGFLLVYRRDLIRFALWKNKSMCERFMQRVRLALDGHHSLWAIDNIYVIRAYQEVTGRQIKPTLADLRKLSDGTGTSLHSFVLNHYRWPRVVEFAEWLIGTGHSVQITTSLRKAETVDGKPFSKSGGHVKGSPSFILCRLYEHFLLESTDIHTDDVGESDPG